MILAVLLHQRKMITADGSTITQCNNSRHVHPCFIEALPHQCKLGKPSMDIEVASIDAHPLCQAKQVRVNLGLDKELS